MSKTIRTCVLYVRISLDSRESVAIEGQIEAGTAYALARGWKVVGVFRDRLSATYNKPQDRPGWQGLLASKEQFDAVVVWKVDRLARRVIDFLDANEVVKRRGAAIVAVEDPVDMTTAQGEAFATMLAIFGQIESDNTRVRVTAARNVLLRAGRYTGGTPPYGYRAVDHPDGAGHTITKDDEVIGFLQGMVRRTLDGYSLYSTTKWLDEVGAPTATMLRAARRAENDTRKPVRVATKWSYNTVDHILHHPLLAGMMPHNPGRRSRTRGEDVVRDDNGLPVVNENWAVMPVGQWRAMQAKLAEPSPQRAPRAMRRKTSGVLSGLLVCGDPRHDETVRMHRGTAGSTARPAYECPKCHQTLSNAEDVIVRHFLDTCGAEYRLNTIEEVVEGGSVLFQEASIRLNELAHEFPGAPADRKAAILAELERVGEIQEEARNHPSQVRLVPVGGDARTFAEEWAATDDAEERNLILRQALDRVVVRRGKQGAWTDAAKLARCEFVWKPGHGPYEPPTDEEAAAWAAAYYKP